MALLEKYLIVKLSKLPGAGMGLFTKIFIAKGTLVVEYKGRITTWGLAKHDVENEYLYAFDDKNNSRVVDARRTKKALGRYANDAYGIKRIKGTGNNCVYINDGRKVFIRSVKDIPAGSEILVQYGKEYWDVKKSNLVIDKKQQKES